MKLFVCLETVPDPDSLILNDGNFNFKNAKVRLDKYSAIALEFALNIKDRYAVPLEALLLDPFKRADIHEDIRSLGCDTVQWITTDAVFDPFARAEIFSDAIKEGEDDIILTGYHCETCCTNSLGTLISLHKKIKNYHEIDSFEMSGDSFILTDFKSGHDTVLPRTSAIVSVRTGFSLRYPTLSERMACQEGGPYEPLVAESALDSEKVHIVTSSGKKTQNLLNGDPRDNAEKLVQIMVSKGMFNI
jgi:electron transfer flavoprotein alpha/beta subunit